MAEIQPLRALHYDQAVVGPLADVVAPPYDVIDDSQRARPAGALAGNVVAVDLPKGDGDVYERAGRPFEALAARRRARARPEPALWVHTQQYTGPDGVARTRRGFFCRVRIEPYGPGRVRPHERTHPGPKEDRLRLTRATRANLSPIFSLYSDPQQAAWGALDASHRAAALGRRSPTGTGPFTASGAWPTRERSPRSRPPRPMPSC